MLVLTVLASVAVAYVYPYLDNILVPLLPANTVNVAVADFASMDAVGNVRATDVGKEMAALVAAAMLDASGRRVLTNEIAVWNDSTPEEEKHVTFGIVRGSTAAERQRAAAALANRAGADVVIYGTYTADQQPAQVELHVYLQPDFSDRNLPTCSTTWPSLSLGWLQTG